MATPEFWQAFWLTGKLAATTTLLLLAVGIPIAYFLYTSRTRTAPLVEALVTLPIVLPPTVIGFYLLVLFSPDNLLGHAWQALFGQPLAFSFSGLVAASVVYSLPFAVQPFQAAFRGVSREWVEASFALGAGRRQTFLRVVLPAARRGVWAGMTLSFAHTLGEFGVVLMVGGSIPGQTRVVSIALYDEVQKLNFAHAHAFAAVLLAVAFVLLLAVTMLQARWGRAMGPPITHP